MATGVRTRPDRDESATLPGVQTVTATPCMTRVEENIGEK